MFEDPTLCYRYKEVVASIRARLSRHKKAIPAEEPRPDSESGSKSQPRRKNAFASRTAAQRSSLQENDLDAWDLFNDDSRRFEAEDGEDILPYWKRQHKNPSMEPLSQVARDVLGLAASTVEVERLFSQGGFVFGLRRGSLSPRMLVKQVSLVMWRMQGFKGAKK